MIVKVLFNKYVKLPTGSLLKKTVLGFESTTTFSVQISSILYPFTSCIYTETTQTQTVTMRKTNRFQNAEFLIYM